MCNKGWRHISYLFTSLQQSHTHRSVKDTFIIQTTVTEVWCGSIAEGDALRGQCQGGREDSCSHLVSYALPTLVMPGPGERSKVIDHTFKQTL